MGGPARIDGKYVECTDNFFICSFKVEGDTYASSEHYFQAIKCIDPEEKKYVMGATSGMGAWSRGNSIKLRKGWDAIRVDEMYIGNLAKFQQNEKFKEILIGTKGPITCGGSTGFWNRWNAVLLERIREELREEKDRDKDKLEKVKGEMKTFREEMIVKLGLKKEDGFF